MKKKVLVITGTRAEYGLFRPTLRAIEKNRHLELHVLATGMHLLPRYGNTLSEIKSDSWTHLHIAPISNRNIMLDWLNEEISGIKKVCESIKPNLILVLGDRDEPLAGAIVGTHLNIPVAHIHGGDVTGTVTVDDRIRDAITSFSKLHFPVSEKSATRIKQILGHKTKHVFLAGSVGSEEMNEVLNKNLLAVKYQLSLNRPWILFVMHPTPLETTSFIDQIGSALKAMEMLDVEIIGIYPNSDTGSDIFIKQIKKSRIFTKILPSLPRKDYLSFLRHCHVIVGNSSSAVLEAPFFGTYVVNIGRRQQDRSTYQNKTDVSYNTQVIRDCIVQYLNQTKILRTGKLETPLPSQIIVSHLESYLTHDSNNK